MTVLEEKPVTRTTGAVALRGITKRFADGPNVLEDVSLDVAEGEFLCLLGASGCGKSTLLNLVAGLTSTTDAPTLFSLGVRRVSLGGSLARAALTTLERAGRELLDTGTLGFLDGAVGYADLQRRFEP